VTSEPKLIVNADDFGLSKNSTHAIIEAFDKKLISSTTMCANGSYFNEACALARSKGLEEHVGIHLNLTEGWPLTEGLCRSSRFCRDNGLFHGKINRLSPLNRHEKILVREELSAQIERMRSAGFKITHADSHHHIHTGFFIISDVIGVLKKYNINKIRIHRNLGKISSSKKLIKFFFNKFLIINDFITVERFGALNDLVSLGSVHDSTIEVMVHPDYDGNGLLIDNMDYNENIISGSLQDSIQLLGATQLYSYFDLKY
jgi:hypothetical protein